LGLSFFGSGGCFLTPPPPGWVCVVGGGVWGGGGVGGGLGGGGVLIQKQNVMASPFLEGLWSSERRLLSSLHLP